MFISHCLAACSVAHSLVTVLPPPLLRGRHQMLLNRQLPSVCDIADMNSCTCKDRYRDIEDKPPKIGHSSHPVFQKVLFCTLAQGPAPSAASDGMQPTQRRPPCSERKRGVCHSNAYLHPPRGGSQPCGVSIGQKTRWPSSLGVTVVPPSLGLHGGPWGRWTAPLR